MDAAVGVSAGLPGDSRPGEDVAFRAVAFGPMVDEVLVTAQAEGPGPRDIPHAGRDSGVAAGTGAAEVRCAGVSGRRRGLVTAHAVHVRLMVRRVAPGAVGVRSAQRESARVAGGAFDPVMGRVIEGQPPLGSIEGPEADIHGTGHPATGRAHAAGCVAAGAFAGGTLGVVAGPAVPERGDDGPAVRALAAVTRLAFDALVLRVPEREVHGGRPPG
jgi:hypothetical protein